MWHLQREAGINRSQLVTTNIARWYLGDADRIGKVTFADLGQARTALLELLTLLPRLRAVVLTDPACCCDDRTCRCERVPD